MTLPRYKTAIKEVALAAGVVLLAAFVVFAKLPETTIFMHVLHKTGHPVVFGMIALFVYSLLGNSRRLAEKPAWMRYLVAFAIAVIIGALTEVGQLFTHRDARVADVLRDAVGATAFLASRATIAEGRRPQRSLPVIATIASVALLTAAAAFGPLAWCLAAYAVRDAQFPVILQDPSRLDMYFVSTVAGNVSAIRLPGDGAHAGAGQDGKVALKVAVDKGTYPGTGITEPYPRWRGYQSLGLDIINPRGPDLEITVRVHDRQHNQAYDDRFNRTFAVAGNTRSTIVIPLRDIQRAPKGRLLNLDEIAGLLIFVTPAVPGGEFIVSRIWLE